MVVMNLVMHHLGRPEVALREVFRVLRPGGRVGFTVWADPAKLQAFGLFFGAVAAHVSIPVLPHGPLFGVSDFAVFHRLVGEAGFHNSAVGEVPTVWRTTAIESLLAGFDDWAQMDTWPADQRAAVEADVRAAAQFYIADGVLVMPNPVILVTATK